MEFVLKDSGQREEFTTGARRDTRTGKGRFDLISPRFLRRLALVMERGAVKYGDRNWEIGIPLGRYLDSAIRHIIGLLLRMHDEDHAAQAAFNLQAFIHTSELIEEGKLPRELDDIGFFQVAGPGPDVAVSGEEEECTSVVDMIPRSHREAAPRPYLEELTRRIERHLRLAGPRPARLMYDIYRQEGASPCELVLATKRLGITLEKFQGDVCWTLPEQILGFLEQIRTRGR